MAHGVYECDAVLDVIQWRDEYDGVLTDCAEFHKFEDMGIHKARKPVRHNSSV